MQAMSCVRVIEVFLVDAAEYHWGRVWVTHLRIYQKHSMVGMEKQIQSLYFQDFVMSLMFCLTSAMAPFNLENNNGGCPSAQRIRPKRD